MKFYYWSSVKTLRSYGSGQAFALANSKEEAVNLVLKTYGENEQLRKELTNTEPDVYNEPVGFYEWGSA